MNRDHFWLTDRQFARIALPTDTRGKPRVDHGRVISGIARGAGHRASALTYRVTPHRFPPPASILREEQRGTRRGPAPRHRASRWSTA